MSPVDNNDSRISLLCRHQAAARKPTFPYNSALPRFQAAYFSLQLVPLRHWSTPCNVQVQRRREGKLFSFGRMASRDLPLSRTDVTDKCKISIMIYTCIFSLLQHTFGHHVYTNIDLADPDIATNPKVS